jgi:hypothetical protein
MPVHMSRKEALAYLDGALEQAHRDLVAEATQGIGLRSTSRGVLAQRARDLHLVLVHMSKHFGHSGTVSQSSEIAAAQQEVRRVPHQTRTALAAAIHHGLITADAVEFYMLHRRLPTEASS